MGKKKKKTAKKQPPKTIQDKINEQAYRNQLIPVRRSPANEESWQEYQAEHRRLHELFKSDALAEVGLTQHPKANKAFDLAWDDGHGYGLREVLYHLERYADLLLND